MRIQYVESRKLRAGAYGSAFHKYQLIEQNYSAPRKAFWKSYYLIVLLLLVIIPVTISFAPARSAAAPGVTVFQATIIEVSSISVAVEPLPSDPIRQISDIFVSSASVMQSFPRLDVSAVTDDPVGNPVTFGPGSVVEITFDGDIGFTWAPSITITSWRLISE